VFSAIEPSLPFEASGNYTYYDYSNGYYLVTFNGYGTIRFSDQISTVGALVVGGGGEGGSNGTSGYTYGGGGGQGGQILYDASKAVIPYKTYTCDVGGGGTSFYATSAILGQLTYTGTTTGGATWFSAWSGNSTATGIVSLYNDGTITWLKITPTVSAMTTYLVTFTCSATTNIGGGQLITISNANAKYFSKLKSMVHRVEPIETVIY